MSALLFLLLPFAFVSGWLVAKRASSSPIGGGVDADIPSAYLEGLNFLINADTDRAIETFLKVAEIDSDTIDAHLALGALYRGRGEVQRAIYIHQNLVDRKNLTKSQRVHALMNLAKDYLAAGLFDRAELLLQELAESGRFHSEALLLLVEIYQQERDWLSAIDVAKRYSIVSTKPMHHICAHYYCELAEEAIREDDLKDAEKYIKQAIGEDPDCVRASILKGKVELLRGNTTTALRALRNISVQDPSFLAEVGKLLEECYTKVGEGEKYFEFLASQYERDADSSLVGLMADSLLSREGSKATLDFLLDIAKTSPAPVVLRRILDIGFSSDQGLVSLEEHRPLVHKLVKQSGDGRPKYRCGHCGFETKALHWNCPSCKDWGHVKRVIE